jgi:predicted dithiol-disulfide oxidoreductase (DUF899 family)
VSCLHGGNGNAHRIGGFNRRSRGGAREQTSRKKYRQRAISKTRKGEEIMTQSTVENPKVVTRDEWIAARKELLAKEKALTRQRDALAHERLQFPWLKVEKNYVFDTPVGKKPLADLFGGKNQLVIYHFMLGADWEAGCPSCSLLTDQMDPMAIHLAQRDVRLMLVSHAPLAKIEEFKKRMGWRLPWASSFGSDFNFDYEVSVKKEDTGKESIYNYALTKFPSEERPGMSIFYKNANGEIFHTFSVYGRGLEDFMGIYAILDRVPKGRDEGTKGMSWVRHHDKYPESNIVEVKAAKT